MSFTDESKQMAWVRQFYQLQNEWLQVYLGDIDDWHQKRVDLITELSHYLSKRKILELGAGGGQTSLALAREGHQISMIELLEDSVKHARFLAENHKEDFQFAPRILCGDFYEIELDETFDIVCYFDSFGIGTDVEQRQLLHRIYHWLKPDSEAFALIEVGNPIYWASNAKDQKMDFGEYIRVYDFDAATCRLLDYWYPKKDPKQAVHQRLRCYTLPDLQLLLEGTNLKIDAVLPSGKMDYERMKWVDQAELIDCMTYYVRLRKQA